MLLMEAEMRKLIAGMKVSLDQKVAGPDGYADWVDSWSEEYGLTPQIDACVIGAGMYPGYEGYWTAIRNEPDKPLPMGGRLPSKGETEWARFIGQTTHYVLSTRLNSASWPNTRFLRGLDEVSALKQQPGKDIYLMGGAGIATALIDAGLVDELRLIVYPLIAGGDKTLFPAMGRRGLELRSCQQLTDGRVSLIYDVS
jgi:dihydrofolate reductase